MPWRVAISPAAPGSADWLRGQVAADAAEEWREDIVPNAADRETVTNSIALWEKLTGETKRHSGLAGTVSVGRMTSPS
jgi:hypothetical protein